MTDIRKPLKKFLPHLMKAKEEGLNEADTVQRIILFLQEVLGYDPLTEITCETQVKEKFVDVAIKLEGKIRLLIEAKSAGTILRDRHLEQAERYAAEGNYPWALLTNGLVWKLYHLAFDEGIEYERVFEVDLEAEEGAERGAELLGLLHRSAWLKGELEEYWRHRQALDPESLARALFTEEVLRLLRRQIRRREGPLIDIEDLAAALKELFSPEARERIGAIRIQRKRRAPRKTPPSPAEAPPIPAPSPPPAAAKEGEL